MRKIFIILFITVYSFHSFSQGCSDAGFCTISDMDNSFEKSKNSSFLQMSEIFGLGEQQVLLFTTQLDLNVKVEKNLFQLRLPYHYITGNLGENYGIGDLSLSYSRQILGKDEKKMNMIIGAKVPVNNADKSLSTALNHLSLPMVYQLSLGTYDLILGLSYVHKNWHIAVAYQYPFSRNDNKYAHAYINESLITSKAYFEYNESARLKRSDDVMLRIEKVFNKNSHQYALGILPIYHLKDDQILVNSVNQKVEKSSGITININVKANWKIKDQTKLYSQLAVPLLARENRPDGLTRSLVASVGLIYNLN